MQLKDSSTFIYNWFSLRLKHSWIPFLGQIKWLKLLSSVVQWLACLPLVRGLKPVGRDKNQNHDFLQRGSAAGVHM
jgi:hypothetical protein